METKNDIKKEQKPAPSDKELRVFVVEDDLVYQQAIGYELRNESYCRVYVFRSGEECFRHLHTLDPHVVILDYRLSDHGEKNMNGIEVLKRLKRIKPDLYVVMLSGQETFEVAMNSIRYGAFDYVVKGSSAFVRMKNQLKKIRRMLDLTEKEREHKWYVNFIIVLAVLFTFTPLVLQFLLPEWIHVITLSAFGLLAGVYVVLHKRKFAHF